MNNSPVNVDAILDSLKDFQRLTSKYVYKRLFKDADGTKRFLVADEVGLGKTMVARGIIAQMIDELWKNGNKQIDVIYVCCNQDLAAQNIDRLKVTKEGDFFSATRLTLIARRKIGTSKHKNRLNFVSLTPGTSFNPHEKSLGDKSERVLLYHILNECWQIEGEGVSPLNMLAGNTDWEKFRDEVNSFSNRYEIDEAVVKNFKKLCTKALREEFSNVCKRFPKLKSKKSVSNEDRVVRQGFIAKIRTMLATASVSALSPDIVILDEFQRFRDLLDDSTPAGELAHQLFKFKDHESEARVLLLSATPYKMYTIAAETSEDNHYEEFLKTVGFLLDDTQKTDQVRDDLESFRSELVRHPGQITNRMAELRQDIQNQLRAVMTRTERLAVSLDRNGMLTECISDRDLAAEDIQTYCQMQEIARAVNAPDILEYWKSAPYLLNFMDDYQLKRDFTTAIAGPNAENVSKLLSKAPKLLLEKEDIDAGLAIEPQNARLRKLTKDLLDSGAWKLLWIPPTLPYYPLEGEFASKAAQNLTKRLIFSSWKVVPKVIASLLSYDAERRAHEIFRSNTKNEATDFVQSSLLRFSRQRDGKPAGMANFGLLYPSLFFSRNSDPESIASNLLSEGKAITLESISDVVTKQIEDKLQPFLIGKENLPEDESWYWAAPLLLDMAEDKQATEAWLFQEDITSNWQGEPASKNVGSEPAPQPKEDEDDDTAWSEHVERLRNFAINPTELGGVPQDLFKVLTQIAISGPANCALRALAKTTNAPDKSDLASQTADSHDKSKSLELRNSAAAIGWAFRNHFNRPHVITLIRGLSKDQPYWKSVLEYSTNGCLQAVLDEYCHLLKQPSIGSDVGAASVKMATAISSALSLRPSNLKIDYYKPNKSKVDTATGHIAARFALPLVEAKEEIDQDTSRTKKVQEAFNSPFWPFVVASTSIGQEGLDFHTYCHAIIHWNLPSNPVDMEQREGRIQRYKGHAVRKNVASANSAGRHNASCEPWEELFARAAAGREEGQNELTPYWIYPIENGATIERHVQALPLSRELGQLQAIRRTLAVYRLVFGQPRQDDLVQYVIEQNSEIQESELTEYCAKLNIDLTPPS